MPVNVSLGEQFFPPFEGFPQKGIDFLKQLKRNNNRAWFQSHREVYDQNVRFPMQCLIATVADRMADSAPEIDFNPAKSIFRIYRDVRFSRNKAPYKTNIAASFQLRGRKHPTESPGLYVGIEPGEIFVGGGLYLPTGDQLKAIRRAIATDPGEFLAVVNNKKFKRVFGELEGEKLLRAPLGFPKDHPMLDYLRYKQLYVGKILEDSACLKGRFSDTVVSVFEVTMPLVRWLAKAVS